LIARGSAQTDQSADKSAHSKEAPLSARRQVAKALDCKSSNREFDSHRALQNQTLERESMNTALLSKNFGRIGARVHVGNSISRWDRAGIDIRVDDEGEYFDIRVEANDKVDYEVIDVRPDMRHLLLMARRENGKQKFLCGHDERHWFVCAVPGQSVSNVVNAMEALQPVFVRGAVHRRVKRAKDRLRRKNKAFVRQGEWFFVPEPSVIVNPKLVLRNEPLSRGGGSKAHMCQFLYRTGGMIVWVCQKYPRGVSEREYRRILLTVPNSEHWGWLTMRRDPSVFVRGRVSHPDHKTIVLNAWHRVFMNTEREAPGMTHVVFLD
jgi:hypothetical protein